MDPIIQSRTNQQQGNIQSSVQKTVIQNGGVSRSPSGSPQRVVTLPVSQQQYLASGGVVGATNAKILSTGNIIHTPVQAQAQNQIIIGSTVQQTGSAQVKVNLSAKKSRQQSAQINTEAELEYQRESQKLKDLLLQREQQIQTQEYRQEQQEQPVQQVTFAKQPKQPVTRYQTLITPIHSFNHPQQQQQEEKVVYVKEKSKKKERREQPQQQYVQQPVQQEYVQPKMNQFTTEKLEAEIQNLQELIKQRNVKSKKKEDETLEIVIDQKNNNQVMKKLVQKNNKLEKELAAMRVKQEEYLYKYKTLKQSWELKDDEIGKLKSELNRSKAAQNELILELERYKMRCHYLEEDLAKLKANKGGQEQKLQFTNVQYEPQQPVQQFMRQEPIIQEKIVEKIVEKPVETVVEKIIDRPIEVEKIVEKIVEVPIEKVVEIIKEIPVNFDNTFERDTLRNQIDSLQRDLENCQVEIQGRMREIESWKQRCVQLEEYHRTSDQMNSQPREQFDNIFRENMNLKKKIELLYNEIKDITYQNDHKNQHLENHIRSLEQLLSHNSIQFSQMRPVQQYQNVQTGQGPVSVHPRTQGYSQDYSTVQMGGQVPVAVPPPQLVSVRRLPGESIDMTQMNTTQKY